MSKEVQWLATEINRDIGKTFGNISELYERARISYPNKLIDDIIKFSKIDSGKILDVGCGSGQATVLFAELGFSIIGLDISEDLIAIAKKKCSNFSKVEFQVGSFEEAEFKEKTFDITLSALAWHWIKPVGRYEKIHKILKNGGTLALFWSYQHNQSSLFLKEVGLILDKYGGKGAGPAGSRLKDYAELTFEELKNNKLFSSIQQQKYFLNINFTKQKYLDLVISYGWAQKLSKKDQDQLILDLQDIFKKYDEPLIIPYVYMLILGRKK